MMMVMSAHGKHSKQVDGQTHRADKQQLACIHLRRIETDGGMLIPLNSGQALRKTDIRWIASNTMKIEMRMRKMPFANPDIVSIRPYPYVKRSFGGQVAITDANKPIAIAIQSKAMWMASKRT